jgi:DNA invertase Pin-like site-specific DNA recombinase
VGFQSVTESIDTTTSGGKLVFHIFAALAEFERTLIRERTRAGLKAARARGRQGGRPKVLSVEKQRMAQALRDDPSQSINAICKTLGISRTTFYRYTEAKS